MVSLPKVGTSQKLEHSLVYPHDLHSEQHLPMVHFVHNALVLAVEYSQQMNKQGFPDAEFKFMHKINHQH